MQVKRVDTKRGSRVEPPLNDRWNDLTKLRWKAAVVGIDSGVTPEIQYSKTARKVLGVWVPVRGQFQVLLPGGTRTTGGFDVTWSFLNGFEAGVQCK